MVNSTSKVPCVTGWRRAIDRATLQKTVLHQGRDGVQAVGGRACRLGPRDICGFATVKTGPDCNTGAEEDYALVRSWVRRNGESVIKCAPASQGEPRAMMRRISILEERQLCLRELLALAKEHTWASIRLKAGWRQGTRSSRHVGTFDCTF